MKIHYIQHEKLEDLGCIRLWLLTNNDTISYTHIWENPVFPEAENVDMLIILGGSMSANDDDKYEWMTAEKVFIQKCLQYNVAILGICLGSQLVANVLGAKVYAAPQKEIGWFDITAYSESEANPIFNILPKEFITLHFHGDTFDLPHQTKLLYSSQQTKNQAFAYKNNVIGLQFHLEMIKSGISELFTLLKDEPSGTIQSKDFVLSKVKYIEQNNDFMYSLLDWLKTQN